MGFFSRVGVDVIAMIEFHLHRYWRSWLGVLLCSAVLIIVLWCALAPPLSFTGGTVVKIPKGTSAEEAAHLLAQSHVIAHPRVLIFIMRVTQTGAEVKAGAYRFPSPESALTVASRITKGDFGIPPVRLTFIEGETARDFAALVAKQFITIREDEFLSKAQPYEGYLFPDTYLFSADTDSNQIVDAARANFYEKIAPLSSDIAASGFSMHEIITIASLIEKEAHHPAERRMIAGIIENRLKKKMPLQIDAVFGYIYGRDTYSPSYEDLKVDSPYNTYLHAGLPPGPICNPGLDAIKAVLHPTPSKYLYYLTGRDGITRYATTFAEHEYNRQTYLVR